MGLYINPPTQSKEAWLEANATEVTRQEVEEFDFSDESRRPLVHVDNGAFTACAIAPVQSEIKYFCREGDLRPMRYFIAPVDAILKVEPMLATAMKEL